MEMIYIENNQDEKVGQIEFFVCATRRLNMHEADDESR